MAHKLMKIAGCAAAATAMMGIATTAQAGKSVPPPQSANPVLVYLNGSGAIEVANDDGKANIVVRSGVPAHRPTWGPTFGQSNAGSSAEDPWYIYYEYDYCNEIRRFPLWKTGTGGLQTGLDQTVNQTKPVGSTCAATLDPSPTASNLVLGTAYVDAGQVSTLETIDGSGAPPTVIYDPRPPVGVSYAISWTTYSGDGNSIAFNLNRQTAAGYADSLQIATRNIDNTWSISELTPFGAIGARYTEWSPDRGSKQLAYSDGTGIHIINTETGVIQNLGPGSQPTWSADGTKLYFSGGKGLAYIALINPTVVTTISARGPHHPKYRN